MSLMCFHSDNRKLTCIAVNSHTTELRILYAPHVRSAPDRDVGLRSVATRANCKSRFDALVDSRITTSSQHVLWKSLGNGMMTVGAAPELVLDRKSTRLNSSHIPLSRMP